MRQNPLIVRTNFFEISDAIEAKSALVTKCLGLDKNSSPRHFSRIMQAKAGPSTDGAASLHPLNRNQPSNQSNSQPKQVAGWLEILIASFR